MFDVFDFFLEFWCPCRYLELADWELKEALQSAKEDREWEREGDEDKDALKSGQISIKVNMKGGRAVGLRMKGTGHNPKGSQLDDPEQAEPEQPKKKKTIVVHAKLPAIATKSVLAEDVYNVSSH